MKKLSIISLLLILVISFFTFFSYAYENHCWNDVTPISSNYNDKCPVCGWYVCPTCGGCSVGNFHYSNNYYNYDYYDNSYNSTVDSQYAEEYAQEQIESFYRDMDVPSSSYSSSNDGYSSWDIYKYILIVVLIFLAVCAFTGSKEKK